MLIETEWNIYYCCPCGKYRGYAWRGDFFFLNKDVCPECGTPNDKWTQKVCRIVYGKGFWNPPSHWEEKEFVTREGSIISEPHTEMNGLTLEELPITNMMI